MAAADGVPWYLTHTILANRGGFALRFSEPYTEERIRPLRYTQSQPVRRIISNSKATAEEVELLPLVFDIETATTRSRQSSQNNATRDQSCSTNLPQFLLDFRKSQDKHLAGLGETLWKPFQPHVLLAASARTDTRTEEDEVLTSEEQYKKNHIAPLQGNIWFLDSKQLAVARKQGVLSRLPLLKVSDIQDRSKSDGLVRTIALLQVLWLMTQLVRSVENIDYSAIEVSTLAFAACAMIVYVVEWSNLKMLAYRCISTQMLP